MSPTIPLNHETGHHQPPRAATTGQHVHDGPSSELSAQHSEGDVTDLGDLYVCGYCGRRWVIPRLARHCEAKHEADE